MENGKSPGIDGLPSEFYKQFFGLFSNSFTEYVNYCFVQGELADSQKLGIITLLCKNPQKAELLGNWRPISLLNVDYKIISKVLSLRLSHVLKDIVNIDQTCGVPGRSIGDNIHLIRNVMQYANDKGIGGAVISLDQAKAFDRVSHDFMFKCLEKYNFGPNFIRWIKILYKGSCSKVLVNGFFTETFQVSRSVRQGCSISPLLYVLYIELFADMVR